MKFTVGWLKDYLDFDCSLLQLSHKLTSIGLEVENIRSPITDPDKFIVCEVIRVEKHPNADKLKICDVSDGKDNYTIVCGAQNVKNGLITVLAKEGAIIYNLKENEFKISKSKIRGIESNGMLCSEEELGIEEKSTGIIELNETYEVGKSFSDYVSDEDIEIEIAITPNRVDCAGVYGIARDLSASGLGKLKELKVENINSSRKSIIKIDNKLKDKDCPQFFLREVKNVSNTESPDWMLKRFRMTDIKIISCLVDVTNYINFDICRPLHVFDADKIEGNIIIRHSKKGEKFLGLDDQEYILDDNMIVICDENKIISLAGILGGKNSCCDHKTKNILIESAYFLPDSISSTGRKLNIQSDARYRFERGIDPESTKNGINLASKMITELCGGELCEIINDNTSIKQERSIQISSDFINQILGTKLNNEVIKEKLLKIGCLIENKNSIFLVTPPSWRQDISIKEDLVEEVARLYGYDSIENEPMNIKKRLTNIANINQKSKKKIKEVLVSRNINEIINWSFVNNEWEIIFGNKDPIEIENPISSEQSVLRSNLVGGLLSVVKKNNNKGKQTVSIFEFGPTFSHDKKILQRDYIVVMRSGMMTEKSWVEKDREFDVFDIKEDLIEVLKVLDFKERSIKFTNEENKYYHPGKSCIVEYGNQLVGSFGEVHPLIKKKFGIKNNVCMFELNFSNLSNLLKNKIDSKKEFLKLLYQSSVRDFSFYIDKKLSCGDIVDHIYSVDLKLIKRVKIFDNYDQGSSERAIGVEVVIQSNEKTLSEKEINNLSDKIIKTVEDKFNAKLR
ncbi:MAG: phenylalanine--tRNA ligase subunit beta [Alphaproteobacteria bacterium]